MKGHTFASVIVAAVAVGVAPASAQTPVVTQAAGAGQSATPRATPTEAQQREFRYQIAQIERALETAVEHGANMFRERFQAALPSQLLITENAHVRGFHLDGYGFFFDVEVPGVNGTVAAWSLRTLDQNNLGLDRALKDLKQYIESRGDSNLRQALRRVELQIAPALPSPQAPEPAGTRTATATLEPAEASQDAILADPEEAFRKEVRDQIMDAMLEYTGPLTVNDDEWLTIAARRHDERPLIAPADSDAPTVVIRIRGGDLAQYRARQLTKAEALKKMEVKVF